MISTKLTPQSFAYAASTTAAILWVVCVIVAVTLPDLYRRGTELLALGGTGHSSLDLTSAALGGALFAAIAWVSGYLFGWNLTKFSHK